jgi:hypothetical protein
VMTPAAEAARLLIRLVRLVVGIGSSWEVPWGSVAPGQMV